MRAPQPDLVSTRTLSAEACASAALALVQQPVLWEALHTLRLMTEAVTDHPNNPIALHDELLGILDGVSSWADTQVARTVELLDTTDRAARSWAVIAHHPSTHVAPGAVEMFTGQALSHQPDQATAAIGGGGGPSSTRSARMSISSVAAAVSPSTRAARAIE